MCESMGGSAKWNSAAESKRVHKDGTNDPIPAKQIRHRDVAAGRSYQVFTVVEESPFYYIAHDGVTGHVSDVLRAYPKSHYVEVPQKVWVDVTRQCHILGGEIMHQFGNNTNCVLKHPHYRVRTVYGLGRTDSCSLQVDHLEDPSKTWGPGEGEEIRIKRHLESMGCGNGDSAEAVTRRMLDL